MLAKKAFIDSLGRLTSNGVKQWKLPLLGTALANISFSGSFYRNKICSTSHLFSVKKSPPVNFSTAGVSYSSPTTPKKEQTFKIKDQVPENFSLVYKANLENYVLLGQASVGLGAICLLGVVVQRAQYLWTREPVDAENAIKHIYPPGSIIVGDTDFMIYFSAMLTFGVALQTVLSQLPLRLYHNPESDQYIAIFYNVIGYTKKFSFSKDDSKKLQPSGISPWKDCKFSLGSKKVILLENSFRLPSDYNALLGLEASDSSS